MRFFEWKRRAADEARLKALLAYFGAVAPKYPLEWAEVRAALAEHPREPQPVRRRRAIT